ncbi:MAG: extracellular solute-binding protein [Treponema sp.]|nr:extracellular solute-binding protein [Treponema sp.]
MKKVLLSGVILLTVFTLISCGGGTDSGETIKSTSADIEGWKLNKDTPITFDWYIHFSWFGRQWGESAVSRYITEKTGVNIRFNVPAGVEAERLNTMIAGDVLPDLLTLGWWEGQIPMMIEDGLVEPLNKLAEEYDPYFFNVAVPDRLAWYTRRSENPDVDGNVYGYPNASFTPSDYEKYRGHLTANETFLVRKDLYEAIGSPDMTTPESFLAALRAAREYEPLVNGQPLQPLGFREFHAGGNPALAGHLQHFLAMVPETADGKYDSPDLGTNNPEYVRWLKTFRQAYSEGLIHDDAFVDQRTQIEEKAAQGRYFALIYQNWDMQTPQMARYSNDPNSIYIAVDGPKNSHGDDPKLPAGGIAGWTLTLISKNCKDKGRAIQFLSYLLSEEGQMDTYFGVPEDNPYGIEATYTIIDGVPTLLPEVSEMDKTDKNDQETKYGVQYTYWMLMDNPWTYQFPQEYSPAVEQPQLWTRPYATSFVSYDGIEMEPGSEEALIQDNIQLRWGSDLPKLLRAKTEQEFDTIWNDFQKFKIDAGFEQLQIKQTELMNLNKERQQTR